MSVNEMLKPSSKLNFDTSFCIYVQGGENEPKGTPPKTKNRILTTKK